MKIAAVVLTGGKSKRFGTNKALLQINGITLLHKTIKVAIACKLQPIFISGASIDYEINPTYKIINDEFESCGPVAGMVSTTKYLRKNTDVDAALFIPTDLPALSSDTLLSLKNAFKSTFKNSLKNIDSATNFLDGVYYSNHPIPLLLNIRSGAVYKNIKSIQLPCSIKHFTNNLNFIAIEETSVANTLVNINTQSDWNKYLDETTGIKT